MYICVECGEESKKLYSTFPGSGILKIQHCRNCDEVVDKYIEFDVTLLLLDVVLLRISAFRHILRNRDTGVVLWKLALLCMFSDGYRKWIFRSSSLEDDILEEKVFHAATQLRLYLLTLVAGLELMIFVGITLVICFVIIKCVNYFNFERHCTRSYCGEAGTPKCNFPKLIQSLLVGNCGKLLFLPTIVWAQSDRNFYYISLYVVCSNTLAISVTSNLSYTLSLLAILAALTVVTLLEPRMHHYAEACYEF